MKNKTETISGCKADGLGCIVPQVCHGEMLHVSASPASPGEVRVIKISCVKGTGCSNSGCTFGGGNSAIRQTLV